jgi:hypothetical protein
VRLLAKIVLLAMHLHLANHALHHYEPVMEDDKRAEIRLIKHHKPKYRKHIVVDNKGC